MGPDRIVSEPIQAASFSGRGRVPADTVRSSRVQSAPMTTDFIPKTALSIHAHPDDQDFTVAGTLAKWARSGCRIVSVIITSGDAGSNDPARTPAYKSELAQLREQEQRAA